MGSWRSQGRHVRYRRRQALANPGVRKHDKKTIDLDQHRGMAAQKATDLRRLLADVEANERALRLRQDELEARLIAAPAANWREAAGRGNRDSALVLFRRQSSRGMPAVRNRGCLPEIGSRESGATEAQPWPQSK